MKKRYFSNSELALWGGSASAIVLSFVFFDSSNYMTLASSLVGVTALIFIAKGNPIGQALTILFSLMYGAISFTCAYYGEMITYIGMTMPMAVFALIAWIRHPYEGNKAEVEVRRISKREIIFMWVLAAAVTAAFYFILKAFNTANLIPSTISVTTSFTAVYLTFRRSPYYAVMYAANDVVLIVLWIMASIADRMYIPVTVCFAAFLANDIYGFINWKRMEKRQTAKM